jgi:hypothetical protein
MKPNDIDHKVLLTKDCIKYIEQSGLSIKDYNLDYSIPSGKGLIYTLSNGEFILMPSTFEESYPGIIFNNLESFRKYLDRDSFPIDTKYMTWLEAHSSEMKFFLDEDAFYISLLGKELKVKLPLTSVEDFETAYMKMVSYVKDISKSKTEKLAVINSYGLAVTEYLIKNKKNKWELHKQYEMYNPYYYPLLLENGNKIDIITNVHITIQNKGKNSFKSFCNYVGLY